MSEPTREDKIKALYEVREEMGKVGDDIKETIDDVFDKPHKVWKKVQDLTKTPKGQKQIVEMLRANPEALGERGHKRFSPSGFLKPDRKLKEEAALLELPKLADKLDRWAKLAERERELERALANPYIKIDLAPRGREKDRGPKV